MRALMMVAGQVAVMMESSEVLGMVTTKDRRRSGYYTPVATVSRKELLEHDLFIQDCYDEWDNYRDGQRDGFGDFKSIKNVDLWCRYYPEENVQTRIQMNRKQEKLLQRRKVRKYTYSKRHN